VSWKATSCLTLLTEDAVEWVFAWLGWRSNRQLDVHQLSPCRVSVDSELLDSFLNTEVHIVDGVVQRWNDHKNGQDGEG